MTTADLWRLYRVISLRRWAVAAVVGCAMLVVGIGVLIMPRYYRATAQVIPSEEALQRPVVGGGGAAGTSDRGYNPEAREERLGNLLYLARNDQVIGRATRELNLPAESLRGLSERITVDTLPRSNIMSITVLDRDPGVSVKLANSLATAFVEFYRELSHRDAVENREFLERELATKDADLRAAEQKLAQFKGASAGANTGVTTTEVAASSLESERDAVEASLRETSARLDASQARLRRESPTMVSEQGTTDNPAVARLRTDLAEAKSQLASERAVHTDKHPAVVALNAKIEDLTARLQVETRTIVKNTVVSRNPIYDNLAQAVADLDTQKAALQAKLQAMDQLVARQRDRAATASSRTIQLQALARDARVAEDTYNRLVAAVDQARVDEKVSNKAGAIQIVDTAHAAEGPVTKGPAPWQLLILGFILSLAVAIGLAITLDIMDDRVKTTDDVMRLLRLPVTGIIPAIEGVRARELPLVTKELPASPYAEAYRFLRTDLLFTCQEQPLQTMCVVTPKPGQGGTTTIANLAIALAEADKRVILVDGDLRRPSLHKIFNLPNEVGLTSVLNGAVAIEDAVQPTDVPNLLVMTGGPAAPNPSRLISSSRMRSLMRELREHADFILFDTPSALVFSDAAIIASITDGTLMVVRARQPLRGSQLQVTALLNKARANIVGAVLNDVPEEDTEVAYYHSRYYQPLPAGAPAGPPALPTAAGIEGSGDPPAVAEEAVSAE